MIFSGGTPAFAADGDTLAVVSTGLTEGQAVGPRLIFHPVFTGDDITKVELVVDGTLLHTWTSVPPALALGSTVRSKWPDEFPLTVRITDAAGGTAEATTDVRYDAIVPYVSQFSPANETTVHGTSVTFTPIGVPDDVTEVDLLSLSGSQVLASSTSAPWSFTWDLADKTAVPLHLVVKFTDQAGNWGTSDLTYKVDNLGPKVKFIWPSVYVDAAVPGGRNVGFADWATDTAGVDRVEWWIGGVQIPDIGLYDFGRTSRTVALEVRAWDKLGNESITPVNVRVDATGPSITSVTPAAGGLLRGSYYHSTIRATDPSGIGYINLNGYSTNDSNSAVPLGKDGIKVWTWDAYDEFNNRSTVKRTVIVDNTKPSLKVTKAPKNKAKVSGTVKIKASASDRNGVNRVELLINGKVVGKDTKSGYTFSFSAKKYGKSFKVQLRAYDRAGNSSTSSTYTWHR